MDEIAEEIETIKTLISLLRKGKITESDAAEVMDMTLDEFREKAGLLGYQSDFIKYFKCITEYDEERTYALYGAQKEAKGWIEGYLKGLVSSINEGWITESEAAEMAKEELNMSVEEFRKRTGLDKA